MIFKREVNDNNWVRGRKGGFVFRYTFKTGNNFSQQGSYYAVIKHAKKDIRFNTLWEGLTFETAKACEKWCESFEHLKHAYIGDNT